MVPLSLLVVHTTQSIIEEIFFVSSTEAMCGFGVYFWVLSNRRVDYHLLCKNHDVTIVQLWISIE